MRKRHFKLFVCFFAIIVSILSSSGVKADKYVLPGLDTNGKPGVGGWTECDEKDSLACISAVVGFRISFYEYKNNKYSFQKAADFYDSNAYDSPSDKLMVTQFNKLANKLSKKNKKGEDSISHYIVDLGFSTATPKRFYLKSDQQKVYKKLYSNLKKNGSPTIKNILKKFNYSDDQIEQILLNKKNRFMVEPLFYLKVHDNSSLKPGYHSSAGWNHYLGTATEVAKKINDSYGDCEKYHNKAWCIEGWTTRCNKPHVERIANSFTLEKKWEGIEKVDPLKFKKNRGSCRDNKYSMKNVANSDFGYGVLVVWPTQGEVEQTLDQHCYSMNNDNCNNIENEISTEVGEIKEGNICKNANSKDQESVSPSEFGQIVKGGDGEPILNNDYCALYCTKKITFTFPHFDNNENEKKGTVKTNWSSITSEDKIIKDSAYDCKIDFKYDYSNFTKEEVSRIVETFGNKIRPTYAQGQFIHRMVALRNQRENADVEKICGQVTENAYALETCRDKIVSLKGEDENWTQLYVKYPLTTYSTESIKSAAIEYLKKFNDWTTVWKNAKKYYNECLTANIDTSKIASSTGDISASDTDGNNIQLQKINLLNEVYGGDDIKTIDVNVSAAEILQNNGINNEKSSIEFIRKYKSIAANDFLEDQLMKRNNIHIQQRVEWSNKNYKKVSFNNNNNLDPYYHSSSNNQITKIAEGSLNYCTWDLSRLNTMFNIKYDDKNVSTFDFSKERDLSICKGSTAMMTKIKSNSQVDGSCPPGTKYYGVNVYSWMDRAESGFSDGIPLAEAIQKVCNGQLGPPDNREYEERKSDSGCSMDDCLIAGNPSEFCNITACYVYACKYTIAGKTVTMYNQLSVYKELYQQIKSGQLKWEEILNQENGEQILEEKVKEIAKKVCETEQCDNGGRQPFVYRTVQLHINNNWQLSFPGFKGNGRNYGSNWTEDTVNKVLDRQYIDQSNPMYKITLTPNTIKQIRNYNKSQSDYNNPSLHCNDDGSACISSFLREELQGDIISGKCANVTTTNFYDSSCVNYKVLEGS